ncbi:MAG TPA: YafY family transcriptional regulator [Devosia sp.]|nr:YafY family transcriptional regulator [Devosia sp.]
MRRTDRLFEILQIFRGGKLCRGRDIAEKLEVSLRTIYRDIDTLVASGIPIEGERGVGYILREPIFLPPLALAHNELAALQLGMEVVLQAADSDLQEAARQLLVKIDAVVPGDRRGADHLRGISIYVAQPGRKPRYLADLRRAVGEKNLVEIDYVSLGDEVSSRRIRPLQCEYWGTAWTCTAWCEMRNDFRVFRIDRISGYRETGAVFTPESGKTYKDYLARF